MKVEGSHRSSLMLLWTSYAALFVVYFFRVSIYQYREERNTGRIGKEVICSSKKRALNGRLQAALRAHCVARGARPSAHFASRVRCAKRLVAAGRWVPFLCTDLNSYSLWFARF